MTLIDSNILVYAINLSSPKHKKARIFLQENTENLVVAHQNIFETLRVLTHPKFPKPMTIAKALKAVDSIARECLIIAPDYKTHNIAVELIKKHSISSDMVFDAYLTATALSNEIYKIATDNEKDFRKFSEIKVVNPFI